MKSKEPQPISPLYILARPRGKVQLWSDGWRCDCGESDCWHIREAKKLYETVNRPDPGDSDERNPDLS